MIDQQRIDRLIRVWQMVKFAEPPLPADADYNHKELVFANWMPFEIANATDLPSGVYAE